jgi:hypothetical protein
MADSYLDAVLAPQDSPDSNPSLGQSRPSAPAADGTNLFPDTQEFNQVSILRNFYSSSVVERLVFVLAKSFRPGVNDIKLLTAVTYNFS